MSTVSSNGNLEVDSKCYMGIQTMWDIKIPLKRTNLEDLTLFQNVFIKAQ